MMQPFPSDYLALLTGTGPWAAVETAALRSPVAALNSGAIIGERYANGDCPTTLECHAGVWTAGKVRPFLRCHDPLPLLTAECDRHEAASIRGKLKERLYHEIRYQVAENMQGLETAHWGNGPGFAGRETSETFLHHCHTDHFRELDRVRWLRWLGAFKEHYESGKWAARKLPVARDWHCMFYRIWLAQSVGDIGGDWVDKFLRDSADAFLAVPMKDHGEPLFHDIWPYALWRYCGERAEEWLVDAAVITGTWTLMLSALYWWITGDKGPLKHDAVKLAAWPGQCYREIGSPIDCYWPPQNSPAVQVPFFLAACRDAGVEPPAKLPSGGLPVHFHPTLGSIVDLVPDGSNALRPLEDFVRVESFGGDAPAHQVTWNTNGGMRIHANWFARISVETDVPFHVRLKAGQRYYVGNCRGTLEGNGQVLLSVENPTDPRWPRNHWLNLTWGMGQPRGMFAGYPKNNPFAPYEFWATKIALAGFDYGMAWIVPKADLVYRPDR